MSRYSGEVGFGFTEPDPPGSDTWVTRIEAKTLKGDVQTNGRNLNPSEYVNPDVSLNNVISLVGTTYALTNIQAIRYIKWRGTRWIVTNVTVQGRRIICSLGEVYNGPIPTP